MVHHLPVIHSVAPKLSQPSLHHQLVSRTQLLKEGEVGIPMTADSGMPRLTR
jgi:hypothetical protein